MNLFTITKRTTVKKELMSSINSSSAECSSRDLQWNLCKCAQFLLIFLRGVANFPFRIRNYCPINFIGFWFVAVGIAL